MKAGVIGSRNLTVENLGDYLPDGTTEIVSGGAKGIDTCAREYADFVIAFWDGKSKGTKFVIDACKEADKKINVIIKEPLQG